MNGIWFYEALILTPGVMQIGFATKQSRFSNHVRVLHIILKPPNDFAQKIIN